MNIITLLFLRQSLKASTEVLKGSLNQESYCPVINLIMSNSFNAVARKHQLRIAKQTLKNPSLALLGGMSLEDAERIVMESKK